MAAAAKIPVIDLPSKDHAEQDAVAYDLVEAAIEQGFIYIRNTGSHVSVDLVEKVFRISKKLFASPTEDKAKCSIQMNDRGWASLKYQKVDPKSYGKGDFMEAFNFGPFSSSRATQPIPSTLTPADEATLSTFWSATYALALRINLLLGIGLAAHPPDFFQRAHLQSDGVTPPPSGTTMRLAYYPPLSTTDADPDRDIRCGAHSDFGSITLLFRLKCQAGLEIEEGKGTGVFKPVPVNPPGTENDPAPPILVNIGDLLSYWTGGLLRSTVHRVVFPGSCSSGHRYVDGETDVDPRYSIAFFVHPGKDAPLEAVPSEKVRKYIASQKGKNGSKNVEEKREITASEHLQMRLKQTYPTLHEGEKVEHR